MQVDPGRGIAPDQTNIERGFYSKTLRRDFENIIPTKDIESYLNNYRGNILIQRLQFIIERSESQRIDALRVGIRAAKKTLNIDAYIEFHEQLSSLGKTSFCSKFREPFSWTRGCRP